MYNIESNPSVGLYGVYQIQLRAYPYAVTCRSARHFVFEIYARTMHISTQIKLLFPRVLRDGKRTNNAAASYFCLRGNPRLWKHELWCEAFFKSSGRLLGACFAQTKSAPNALQTHAPWKVGFSGEYVYPYRPI